MNVFVLVVGVLFVVAGTALIVSGRHPLQGWMAVTFFGGCAVVAAWDLLRRTLPTRNRRARLAKLPFEGDTLVLKQSPLYPLAYCLGTL